MSFISNQFHSKTQLISHIVFKIQLENFLIIKKYQSKKIKQQTI
jgi:hypothetical protein